LGTISGEAFEDHFILFIYLFIIQRDQVKMNYKLHYYALRGRGEPIRLLLALNGQEWIESDIDEKEMKKKAGSNEYPFGQAPVIEEIDGDKSKFIGQMDSILRRLGRRFGQYNGDEDDISSIDMMLSGIDSIRSAYLYLVYEAKLEENAKKNYILKHIDSSSAGGSNSGSHLIFIENMVIRNRKSSGQKFFVSSSPSIADVQLFNIVDLHLRIFGEEMAKNFPALCSIHKAFSEIPTIADYLKSEKKFKEPNGNGLG